MPRRRCNKELNKRIGARLRDVREKAGVTQSRLAELIHSTPPTISRIESGNMAPTLSTLSELASALNVSLAVMFEDKGTPLIPVENIDNLTPSENVLLRQLRELPANTRQALSNLVDELHG